MARITVFLLCMGLLTAITACDRFSKRQTGTAAGAAGGAVLGQVIGGSTEATLLGGAIGGVLGYIVGDRMEQHDRAQLNQTLETNPSYETSSWTNPDTGNQFSATPHPAYEDPRTKQVCRKVQLLAEVDGQTEKTDAVACRQNGRWVLQ
jgi:surface antigen